MKSHRIAPADIYGAMRMNGIFSVCEIEVIIVGKFYENEQDSVRQDGRADFNAIAHFRDHRTDWSLFRVQGKGYA